jgi:hypothetical protein
LKDIEIFYVTHKSLGNIDIVVEHRAGLDQFKMKQKYMWKNMSKYHSIKSRFNCLAHDFEILKRIMFRYKNPLEIIYRILAKSYPVTCKLSNSTVVACSDFQSFYNHLMNFPWEVDAEVIILNGYTLHGVREYGENLFNIFLNGEYDFLEVNGWDVVDVGGNIADSSIYFMSKGAKRVVSVEPNSQVYKMAVKNVSSNSLTDKIQMLNAACCGSESKKVSSSIGSHVALDEIVNLYNIEKGLLKVDCEGCEYDVILSSDPNCLSRFERVQIEYHYGYQNLQRKLESCGFSTRITEPRYFKPRTCVNTQIFFDNMERTNNSYCIGWLYGWKS